MKIAICDDEKIFIKKVHDYLWQHSDCSIDCFLSPSELLAKYEDGERYDVLFLDIVMEPLNGISLAQKIRSYDTNAIIIFLTSCIEYAPAGYEVKAFRYLLKPVSDEDILQVLKDIKHELKKMQKIIFKTAECDLIFDTEDILYLEANDKETTVHCEQDSLEIRKSLNELENQLPDSHFFRIHRKYIVNLARIREFDEKQLTLDCGQTLAISRRKSRDFRNALEAYIEGGLH